MVMKILVTLLAVVGLAFLIQIYANQWFSKVLFTAPLVGTMSVAACILTVVGTVLFAKLSWGK